MALHFWICGNCNVANEYNPLIVLRNPLAQSIVKQLNEGPATAVQLITAISGEETKVITLLSALERTGAVIGEGEFYRLAFPVFTTADQQVVWTIATEVGAEIAHRLVEARPALVEIMSNLSPAQYIAIERLLLAVVGCFALDWGGLKRLEELGYVVRHKAQPGGGDYILFVAEPGDDVKKRFCYSHNDYVGGYVFTTFGDLTGSRNAFPDILRQIEQTVVESVPFPWNNPLRLALRLYFNDLLTDVACILEALAKEPLAEETLPQASGVAEEKVAELFPLLVQLGYLCRGTEGWRPAVPVFLASDKTSIKTAVTLVVDLVQTVVAARYDEIRQALEGISPLRNGVPFAEVFTEVWHFIFAEANRILIETGFMASPARPGPDSARFAAWLGCSGSL
jgi:hypothetical protein